jgi:hypothetical protein
MNDLTQDQEERLIKFYEKNVPKDSPISKHYLLCSGLNAIHHDFYEEITNHSKWISQIILLVENIPICVSISAFGKHDDVYNPLIYVNRHFEITTQYDRNEIVGKNCNFLQSALHKSEISTKNAIQETICNGRACKFLITNYKKDGTPFRNLLHLIPIKFKSGEICYYMGFQCDLSDPKTPYDYVMLVEDLACLIPKEIDIEYDTTKNNRFKKVNLIVDLNSYLDKSKKLRSKNMSTAFDRMQTRYDNLEPEDIDATYFNQTEKYINK